MGPGLLSGEPGCPYHCPCLSSPSPLQALSSLTGHYNSWSEETFSEDLEETYVQEHYLKTCWLGLLETRDHPQQSGLTSRLVTAHKGRAYPPGLLPWLEPANLARENSSL